jgi:hypothetical protein
MKRYLLSVLGILVVALCIFTILWGVHPVPRFKIQYYLWKLGKEPPKIRELHEYSDEEIISRIYSHQMVGMPLERTETMKSLVELGPGVVPYVLRAIKQKELIARGMMIVNEIYLKENDLFASDLGKPTAHYAHRAYPLLPQLWPLVQSKDSKIREIGLYWIHSLGESGDERHIGGLLKIAQNTEENPEIRDEAIRILDSWGTEEHLPVARSIYSQPDQDGSLRRTCLRILTQHDTSEETMSLLRKGLQDRSLDIRLHSAKKLAKEPSSRKAALRVLIELLTCDVGYIRFFSMQELVLATGRGIGLNYVLAVGEEALAYEEYRRRYEQMTEEERAKSRNISATIWYGNDDETRKEIAAQWRRWYEEEYGVRIDPE